MRKMKKHRLIGLVLSIFIYLIDSATGQGNFEDADTLSDLMSGSTGQQFDLRHTIPGIPDVDYPIYSEVPKTSFECTGRHEGYYADMESRCQAFHICTHTARAVSGFGFLCPNGTLFSQKYFVCDWYRNVNCDDSERYYSKNDANRIGSSLDMMETVRQMMEYPMKTISKALQQTPSSSRKPTHRNRNGHRVENQQTTGSDNASEPIERNRNRGNSARKSVTRDQVESSHNRGTKKYYKEEETITNNETADNTATHEQSESKSIIEKETTEQVVDSSSSNLEQDVYVNSLGELSTDPGVHFDRTNAHIIAEPRRYRYEKNMNFAEKVNAALNNLADLPADEKLAPDYVKQMRDNNKQEATQIDLASNINGLLDEIANDLNPNTSGYQIQPPAKTKHTFRFLSRGFSSQNDPYKYQKPKQTASTIRFTPNQLPLDKEKELKKPVFEIADDAVGFGQSSTTTTTTEPTVLGDALDYLVPPHDAPAFNETPVLEEVSYLEPPLLPPHESSPNSTEEPTNDENIITTTPETEVYTVTPSNIELPTYAALIDTTTTTDTQLITEPTTVKTDIAQNLVLTQQQQSSNQKFNDYDDEPIDEDRLDVNKQAENLFLSGLKLTTNENDTETTTTFKTQTPLLIQVADDHSYLTAWVTSTVPSIITTETLPITTTTTTESPATETGSLQARIRNYRRLASLQRATAKPVIYGKRGSLRISPKLTTTNTTTTPKTTTTTRSYLKRVAASRLRLSRLAAAAANRANKNNLSASTTTVAASSSVDNAIEESDNKKFSVRNIDKETSVAGNGLSKTDAAKNEGIVTWESVRNSLQRFQVDRKKAAKAEENFHNPLSPATVDEISTTTRSSLVRNRHRFSNFKLSAAKSHDETLNAPTEAINPTSISKTVSYSSNSNANSNTILPLNFLQTQNFSPQTSSNTQIRNSFITSTNSIADNTNLNSNSAQQIDSSTSSPTFISFDKLTRSIVDDSILQNYRASPPLDRTTLNTVSATNAFQARSSTTALESNAYQVNSHNAYNNQVFATPMHQSFSKTSASASLQLTPPQQPTSPPPQRTAYRPFFSTSAVPLIPTTPGPRVVIARAEGQRIEPNGVSSIISSLITQQQQKSPTKATPTTSYVPLDDFLTRKFGNQAPTKATQIAAAYQQQTQQRPLQYQSQQQQQQYQPINPYRQQTNYQQTITTTFTPPKPTPSTIYTPQHHQQHFQFNQPQQISPATQNIIANYQQQQQKLPQFPPLGTQAPLATHQQSSQTFPSHSAQFNDGNNYLNIQLPALTNGLIPAPTTQFAQKRSDIDFENLQYTAATPVRSVFSGATSYDVPLSSIGRLPNDITALLKRLRRY